MTDLKLIEVLNLIESYKDNLQSYTQEQLRYISDQRIWSLGQMYSHLIIVALEYLDNVEFCAGVNKEQPFGKTEAGEQLYKIGEFPPIKIKLPDLPGNTPSNLESKEDLITGLDRIQQKMIEWEGKVNDINPNNKGEHGGFGWLNAREWFDLIGMHFRHHLRQKMELDHNLGSNMNVELTENDS